MKTCIVIPVYNSENHIANVIENVFKYAYNLIVINDGSTDGTLKKIIEIQCIASLPKTMELVSYKQNRGKGYALKQGFRRALELGFTHAVTMDADGQHLPADIALLTEKSQENPDALIVGSRKFDNPDMPEGSKFANNFSNFWFKIQTGISLPDTQTGFRIYPLGKTEKIRAFTDRYEAELEILVRCAWKNIKLVPQPINVYYPPQNERLSHFRKGKDFFRISVLNTVLCFLAVIYGYPSMFFRKVFKK
ncbi:MAG: glycosyltransferase family 2 protein [Prevotellaceae bacterium]|jgi:glycosyltransferase involved in cell wall biosynthesis|nr:glycosyltransferase family 2 protein [Prevotellaceae bacterium]